MAEITLIEAVNLAMAHEMERDPDVLVFGEDIAKNGGVFRATVSLLEKFGPERVLDTPLAESLIAGLAIGLSLQGLKPVAEIQFMGFLYPALDQIINHASRFRNRTRGYLSCPLVIRTPCGGGIRAPEHHSESTESILVQTPGIKVVVPSSPARAYGLLLAAIRDPDPVIFLEPSRIYRLFKQNVVDNGEALPLGQCFILREGHDVTLVTWGACIHETLQAAQALGENGISAEVIDCATLKPLDIDTILASVEKTGRCVIIHEAPKTCSVGAEIAAQIAENALMFLQAPIRRVAGYDTVMPYFKLEKRYIPTEKRIINTVLEVMEVA